MKVTIQHYEMTYTAECSDDVNLIKVIGRVIVPLLIAAGWSKEGIAALFVDGNPVDWDEIYED